MQTPPRQRRASQTRAPPDVRVQRSEPIRRILQRDDLRALEAAFAADDLAIFMPLLDRGHEVLLTAAVREGCFAPLLAALLEHGAPVNEVGGEHHCTALHWVCGVGASEVVAPQRAHDADANDAWPSPTQQPPPWAFHAASDPPPQAPWAFGAAARPMPLEACSAWVPEERRLAQAACLLTAGADASLRDGNGVTAAEHAEKNGHARLALLVRYWGDLQASRWLQKLDRSKHASVRDGRPSLSTAAPDVIGLICKFLAPEHIAP